MLRPGTQDSYISRKVNMPTDLGHGALVSQVPANIKAQAFFSARVAEARILERLRSVSDQYSRGEIGLGEARNMLKDFLKAEGYNPHQAGLKNLAGTARLNLILKQNAAMAHAAGEWKRMHDPDAMKVFPYVRYHSRGDSRSRFSHSRLDGNIYHKNDPFLKTHTPPWEFNCRCWLEEITAKEAGRHEEDIQERTPPDQVKEESQSGFSFDPEHVFETQDLTSIQPMSREKIIKQAEEAVRDERLGSVGMIVAPPEQGLSPVKIPGENQVKRGFGLMKDSARKELKAVGIDPDHLPDYEEVNRIFDQNKKIGKNIPKNILEKFPKEPFEIAKLNPRATESAGLPKDVPVILGRGNAHHGIEHLWRNHKELFVNPDDAVRLLRETLGNPNCRVVVSMKRAVSNNKPVCLKRIVLHNPERNTYCIMVYDGKELKLVSWNNAGDDYGNNEWSLR